MTKEEVVSRLGPPDDVVRRGEVPRYQDDEVFVYGAGSHLACPTLGRVHFDAGGKVRRLAGVRGTPPPEDLITEAELRRIIPELERFSAFCHLLPCGGLSYYDPGVAIHTAQVLIRAGKRKAFAAIHEAYRIEVLGLDGLIVVRLICDAPPSELTADLGIGKAVPEVHDPSHEWPHWPVVYFSSLPFMPLAGYELVGLPRSPCDQIDYFERLGSLRTELKSTVRFSTLARDIDEFCGRLGEIFPRADRDGQGSVALALRLQYLRLLSLPDLKAPDLDVAGYLHSESEWRSIKRETEQYELVWDPESGDLVRRVALR